MEYTETRKLDRLTEKQLRAELRRLNAIANDRLNSLRAAGVLQMSDAFQEKVKNAGFSKNRFTVPKNATREKLYGRIANVEAFLKSESSTVKGVSEGKARFIARGGTEEEYYNYKRNFNYIKGTLENLSILLTSEQTVMLLEFSTQKFKSRRKALEEFTENYL